MEHVREKKWSELTPAEKCRNLKYAMLFGGGFTFWFAPFGAMESRWLLIGLYALSVIFFLLAIGIWRYEKKRFS